MGARTRSRARGRIALGPGSRRSGQRETVVDRLLARLPEPVGSVVRRARREDVVLTGAGLAFYALVSIAPLVVLTMWAVSLLLGEERLHRLASQVAEMAPKDLGVDAALRQVAEQGTGLGLTAAVLGLWPATSYGSGVVRAFERICATDDRERTPLRGRLLALLVLFPAFLLGSILLGFAGLGLVGDDGLARAAGIALGILGAFAGAVVGSALIYLVFPPDRLPWRKLAKATLVASVGISLASLALVAYVSFGANFSDHYASSGIAAVVLVAVWLFLSNIMLLVGYETAVDGRPDRPRG